MVTYEVRLNGVAVSAEELVVEALSILKRGDGQLRMSERSPIGLALITGIVLAKVLPGLEVVEVEK